MFEATGKTWMAELLETDRDGSHVARDGRVMEMLSEHTLEGWLEGYLQTGRHGLLSTYEAFVHVIDSMFNQHAKWLAACEHIAWRAPIASLNLLITSTVWRQDHNGFTHQDPDFIDLVANKSPGVVRICLPPDANCLLAVADRCLRSTNRINFIVCDKQNHLQYLDIDAAERHVRKGIGLCSWASTDEGREPDVVLAACGDVATQEALAAASLLRESLPDPRLRFVNVVDLFTLTPSSEHPHGLSAASARSDAAVSIRRAALSGVPRDARHRRSLAACLQGRDAVWAAEQGGQGIYGRGRWFGLLILRVGLAGRGTQPAGSGSP